MSTGTERTDSPPPAPLTPGQQPELKPSWTRILLFAGIVALLLGIVYLSPLRGYLGKVRQISEAIRALGWVGPLVLSSSVALLVAFGFPRLVFCFIAGMAFGFWQGLLWAQLGTLVGNYAPFLMARTSGGDWARRFVNKRGLSDLIHKEGITGVILARQLPAPGLLINLALGLVPIRQRDFLLGTIIGQLTGAIPCTLIGAGTLKASYGKSAAYLGLAIASALIVWIGLRWFLRSQRQKASNRIN